MNEDAEWYKKEVGEDPDPDMFSAKKRHFGNTCSNYNSCECLGIGQTKLFCQLNYGLGLLPDENYYFSTGCSLLV